MSGALRARFWLWRVIVVGVCFGVQVRDAAAFSITAAAPAIAQTGASSFAVQDAAAAANGAIASASRSWATDGVLLTATDSVSMAGLGGEMAVTVAEGAGVEAVAGAVVGCIASVVCAVAVGAAGAVAAVAAVYRMKGHGDGSIDVDPGQAPGVTTLYTWGAFGPADAASVCSSVAQRYGANTYGVASQASATGAGCAVYQLCYPGFCSGYVYVAGYSLAAVSGTGCGPVNGVSVPAGYDGMCPTGAYTQNVTAAAAAASAVAGGATVSTLAPAAEEAVGLGGASIPAAKAQVAGPATQAGPAVVTQTASKTDTQGNTVTSTQTVAPTYYYTYNPDGTISVGTQTTTTTANSDGSSSSLTTLPTAPAAGGSSGTGNETPTPGLCDEYPGIVACTKLGDPPTDTVPTGNVSVPVYAPEAVDLPVGCPAPNVINGMSFSYQPLCDAATNAKPWVLVGAAFSALMLVVVAIRTM